MTSALAGQLAAAPISWGVCEAENWGCQLPPERVLQDMKDLGISATEFGPTGFLPVEPKPRAEMLRRYGLTAIGGFFPSVLHQDGNDPLPAIERELAAFEAAGATVLVLSADSGAASYDEKQEMTAQQWKTFGRNLDEAVRRAADRGITAVLHPHVGTMVESAAAVDQLLNSTAANICLDTGHLLIGGTNPLDLVRRFAARVGHAHLKDVKADLAGRVGRGELGFTDGVKAGMFVPLGQGDCGIAELVAGLQAVDYAGWYVMEQDVILTAAPEGQGPLRSIRESRDFLLGL
ncbi:sugar phosphate isomerase/epimerase family protein [Arthrobacter sp. A5]|uniref:sugar phosphate isomerase/epimerase family protein n=1 Tax=Arthrobacter sp. A5 TaxID=576926 RepID=UPI003DA98677